LSLLRPSQGAAVGRPIRKTRVRPPASRSYPTPI
jgi:hypothetical protein